MPGEAPKTIYMRDYTPPDYLVERVDLRFELGEEITIVRSRMEIARNFDSSRGERPLVLQGSQLRLLSVVLDGSPLVPGQFSVDDQSLTVPQVPAGFILEIETEIRPLENTSLEGLYISSGNFCTQCEAEGFRKITYFLDRPDVMARYTTTIVADKARYPVLLSNGNLVEEGDLDAGRHFAVWEDPFRKPSYLYALVAGDLVKIEDVFITASGRPVSLRVYVQRHNSAKCGHAMRSLKNAMRWDEEVYGREYDLDIYMIFVADDFNFGAMENKGLNVFNSKYVLALPETATDADFQAIEEVIGHEYFHNWTGNRITCRDWFQLSMKEGLTIFRDQEFSADMGSRAVKRIADVRLLRTRQFPEDTGPLAHSVRPESYIEINNFYTMTVYYKGAEVVRMIHTLLGPAGFRRGMDLFFERHDGQAVTVEDFVRAMEDACSIDLGLFRLWYSQPGTPYLMVESNYDPEHGAWTMTVRQKTARAGAGGEAEPFHIPFALGLLDREGNDIPLQMQGEGSPRGNGTRVLQLCEEVSTFRFVNIPCEPVPSLLRGFSAPVKLLFDYTDKQLMFLLAHDSDPFNRWEAGQRLATAAILKLIDDYRRRNPLFLPPGLVEAFAGVLTDSSGDHAFRAELLEFPSEDYLAEQMPVVDPEAIHTAREFFRLSLAQGLRADLWSAYHSLKESGPYSNDGAAVGRRRLRNLCLSFLAAPGDQEVVDLCMAQLRQADNMTDEFGALAAVARVDCPERIVALEEFFERWKDDSLVIDKWFSLQAGSDLPGTLDEVKRLLDHPSFDIRNPNRVRSLIGSFCQSNPYRFHAADGSGYRFLSDQVIRLNGLNPQVAARLLGSLSGWRRHHAERQTLMKAELERVLTLSALARDVYEIALKSLEELPNQ